MRGWNKGKLFLCMALAAALGSLGAAAKAPPEDWSHYALDRQKNSMVYFSIPIESGQKTVGGRIIAQQGEFVVVSRHRFYYNPNTYQVTRYDYPQIQNIGFLEDGNGGYYEVIDQDYDAAIGENGVDIQYRYAVEIAVHRRDGSVENLGWFRKSFVHNGESPDSIE